MKILFIETKPAPQRRHTAVHQHDKDQLQPAKGRYLLFFNPADGDTGFFGFGYQFPKIFLFHQLSFLNTTIPIPSAAPPW
ncbi:hypothetical protein [Angelakisella massiliensis]|uniref:hypothetical protein n=1 Tax=Angelakisella massiliensis TaxID=1871018 RepID=UPI0024B04E39|nr:hypothetical protein [Angelakisella massiliensis]